MTNYEAQLAQSEHQQAKWWAAFRDVSIEIGASISYPPLRGFHIELPEGWTEDAFIAEVNRRAEALP